jgi:heptaprenylglyceryl phosphate synthase
MAMIKKDGNFMCLPMNIARGNPIPLDKSEIWYSYEEMLNYAATNPVAYVGQILGLVDEENDTAKAYIILNTDGEVQEVGKATVVDNTTIILDNDDTLSLKDFGKKYYAYVAEKDNVAAHYIE